MQCPISRCPISRSYYSVKIFNIGFFKLTGTLAVEVRHNKFHIFFIQNMILSLCVCLLTVQRIKSGLSYIYNGL